MATIHAIFENGVFKPIGPVELPENCEVKFEPQIVPNGETQDLEGIYEILSRRHNSGESDVAARHNEHQP